MEWHGVTTEMLPQNKGKCKSLSLWTDLGHVQSLSTLNCVDPHNVWGRDGWRFIQNSFLHSPVLLFQCQFLLGGYLSIPVVTVLSPLPFSCLCPKQASIHHHHGPCHFGPANAADMNPGLTTGCSSKGDHPARNDRLNGCQWGDVADFFDEDNEDCSPQFV